MSISAELQMMKSPIGIKGNTPPKEALIGVAVKVDGAVINVFYVNKQFNSEATLVLAQQYLNGVLLGYGIAAFQNNEIVEPKINVNPGLPEYPNIKVPA